MALSHIGAKARVENFETEISPEARELNRWYDFARQQSLEAYNWKFARKRLALALHEEDPPAQWVYRYQWPSDCIAIRRIWNPVGEDAPAVPYEVETSTEGTSLSILTNMEDAVAIYTWDQKTTSLFSLFFISVLSRLLASFISPSLTGNQKITQEQVNAYFSLIRSASSNDGNQQVEGEPRDASWIADRA
jgi:hypothetical protein